MKNIKPSGTKGAIRFTGLVAACIVLLLTVMSIILPDRDFSQQENRMLASFPHFSLTALADGRFTSDVESYVADQFAGRNMWIKLKASLELARGRYDSNGVYLGDDGYLFEDVPEYNSSRVRSTTKSIQQFCQLLPGVDMHFLLVPNSSSVMSAYLPKAAPLCDQNYEIDRVEQALARYLNIHDVRYAFKNASNEEQLYYRTDHHWTTDGAYRAFLGCAAAMGIDTGMFNRERFVVSEDFRGTMASKSGFPVELADSVAIYTDDSQVEYVVKYVETGELEASVYKPDNLEKNDKYTVFFGGNYPRVDISTTSTMRKKLLVIKDSYANCFVPFLIPYYREIIMVDPRYYCGNIYDLVSEESIDQVLFLYNSNTFMEDDSLSGVLGTLPAH